jgi:transcriptional regulator with XRE-family HTH domain
MVKETISDIERGHTRPYDVTLAKLAHAYGVPIEELLVEEPSPVTVHLPPLAAKGEMLPAEARTIVVDRAQLERLLREAGYPVPETLERLTPAP